MSVAQCESSMDAGAYSQGNYGLFQIHYASHSDKAESAEALFDPVVNVAVAHQIWSDQGWSPWPGCGP